MIKSYCILAIMAGCITWCEPTPASESDQSTATLNVASRGQATRSHEGFNAATTKLEAFVAAERKTKDLPAVSMALVTPEGIAWRRGWGSQDLAGRHAVGGDTVYRVGSVSKLFSDMVAVMLVEQGRIDLDADVRDYLRDFAPENPYDTPITMRLLLSHRSGLVREPPVGHYFDPEGPTLKETVRSLNGTELVFKPGTRTKYSNAAIAVVGRVVEVVCDKPFEQCVQDELLTPLGMANSGFRRTTGVEKKLAAAWMRTANQARFGVPTFELGTAPAGNLYSSVNDLSMFLSMVLSQGQFEGRQVVTQAVIDQMTQVIPSERNDRHIYGLGFRIGELDGKKTVGHGGAVYGYATQVTAMPDEKIAVVAVTALDGANGFTSRACDYALRLMLAHRAGEDLPVAKSSKALPPGLADRLAGSYTSGAEWLELQSRKDRLYLRKGYEMREVRCQLDSKRGRLLVIDDVEGYGPSLEAPEDGSLRLHGLTWRPSDVALPTPNSDKFQEYIGEYGWDFNTLYLFEQRGQLWALIEWFYYYPLTEVEQDVFAFPKRDGLYMGERLLFSRDADGKVDGVEAAKVYFKRRGKEAGQTDHAIPPQQP